MVRKDGVIIVNNISGGTVNFDDAVTIAPISITKTVAGSGSANTGQTIITISGVNSTQQE
ncbi:spore germination protein [Neobacillus sp. NPDC058068]|uniref:spore germination protein n=1 Tax=Neobacillus sp. NPDC058068 TaxID=3346325 RepID=UPI0036DCE649